jgi:hypothetical protein
MCRSKHPLSWLSDRVDPQRAQTFVAHEAQHPRARSSRARRLMSNDVSELLHEPLGRICVCVFDEP